MVANLAASGAFAVVSRTYNTYFQVDFYQAGETFDGYTGTQDWTEQQMADIGACIATWDAGILDTPGRQIRIDLVWYDFTGNTLGGSYSSRWGNYTNAWNAGEGVWRDGWTGGTSSVYDTRIVYDSNAAGYSWNFGDETPTSSEVDFRSVVTHELGHSFGFSSSYLSGSDTFWYGGLTAWDQNLVDSSGNRPQVNSTGTPGNFNQTDAPVYFDGEVARAANGGNDVAIYAPSTYSSGSSLTHLDESTFPNALMSPSFALGQEIREPTALEWAMMTDMGWTIVPEPGSVVMLLGLLATGLFWRWRRHRG